MQNVHKAGLTWDWKKSSEYGNALQRKWANLTLFQRKVVRQMKAEPLLDAYWTWVEKLDPAAGSKLEDAVAFARNQKQYLNAFLDHGEVDISNNLAGNAIRPFVVGRKNWLFCETPKRVESSASVYTMVETAKAKGLDPFDYLSLLLDESRYLGKTSPNALLESLLP